MGREALEAAFDMQGAFNDLAIRARAGRGLDAVIERSIVLLAPYGGLGAYAREISCRTSFSDEINQDRVTGSWSRRSFSASRRS